MRSRPLACGKPLTRRAPLRSGGELTRTELTRAAPLARVSAAHRARPVAGAPRPARARAVPGNVRDAVAVQRAGGRCEWCGRPGSNLQHRVPRGMGGTLLPHWCLARLAWLCGSATTGCHGRAESDRTWAEDVGLLVPRPGPNADLDVVCAAASLLLRGHRRVLLDPAEPRYLDLDGEPLPAGHDW